MIFKPQHWIMEVIKTINNTSVQTQPPIFNIIQLEHNMCTCKKDAKLDVKSRKEKLAQRTQCKDIWDHDIQEMNLKLSSKYTITKDMIGQGATAKILKAYNWQLSKLCAVKMVDKDAISKDLRFKNMESKILKMLDHPNIIKVYDTYETQRFEFIFMEKCETDMLSLLLEVGYFSEKECKPLIKQALSALTYLHAKGIVHRDLKLENLLIKNTKKGLQLKIVDFGHSTLISPKMYLNGVCGSAYYIAPEVLKKRYNKKCDLWSMGIILFTVLTGHYPFDNAEIQTVFQMILNHKVKFNAYEIRSLSLKARGLIKKLLKRNVDNRLSARQALQSKWLQASNASKKCKKSVKA